MAGLGPAAVALVSFVGVIAALVGTYMLVEIRRRSGGGDGAGGALE